jgi:hypothetical protein
MSFRRSWIALVCALLLTAVVPGQVAAQDDEVRPLVYGVYMQCNTGAQARVTEIVRDTWGPVVEGRIASGDLSAWGMITHHTGGPWERAVYFVGTDRARMMGALDGMVGDLAADEDAFAEVWSHCPTHEDYIWQYTSGSDPAAEVAQTRPTAGMSTYWVCDEGREAMADLLAEEVFGPLWDAQVEAGLINSWGWFSHFVGGEYRRLLVIDGADHESLLAARGAVIEQSNAESGALAAEFSNVCNGHTDYLWNIEISSP